MLCVTGLLCHFDSEVATTRSNPFGNVVKRPGVKKLFDMLLPKFHVGLWSKLPRQQLKPLLAHLLPETIVQRVSFVYSREDMDQVEKFP